MMTSGFAFVPTSSSRSSLAPPSSSYKQLTASSSKKQSSSSLQMVEQNVLLGAAVGISGLIAGIGLVVFTENQGERAKSRGTGLSDSMATKIAGSLMEDVEVSSVSDLGSLTSQLENALKESGGINDDKLKEIELTEEEKQKIKEDADDGW